jgi:hypothetical protein
MKLELRSIESQAHYYQSCWRDAFMENVKLKRDLKLTMKVMQQTIDYQRKETARVCGLLRNAREFIWNHHADGIMKPDVCPICQSKEFKWLEEQMSEVLE